MEPAEKPQKTDFKKDTSPAMPPIAAPRTNRFAGMLSRTSSAFTAEYSIFLITLGIGLSNLIGFVFAFFSLVVYAMDGGSSGALMLSVFSLWLLVSSLVTLPLAVALWARVQGELAANDDFNGQLPKGAAKGFRTFWIILAALGSIGMLIAAIYTPVAAAIGGGSAATALVAVTVPSLIAVAVNAVGVYLVTRGAHERKKSRLLLWVVAGLTVLLFGITYVWASNMKAPSRATPYSNPYDSEYDYDDPYSDPYYRYDLPSDYR